jgi:hypothetical protein
LEEAGVTNFSIRVGIGRKPKEGIVNRGDIMIIKRLVFWVAVSFLILGCSGGFGTDSDNADEFGPAIFGKDTTKNVFD